MFPAVIDLSHIIDIIDVLEKEACFSLVYRRERRECCLFPACSSLREERMLPVYGLFYRRLERRRRMLPVVNSESRKDKKVRNVLKQR